MSDTQGEPAREDQSPSSWLVPAHEWTEPDLPVRKHFLERQRLTTGPATDDDDRSEALWL